MKTSPPDWMEIRRAFHVFDGGEDRAGFATAPVAGVGTEVFVTPAIKGTTEKG